MKGKCYTTIGPNGEVILWRDKKMIGNYHNGIAKIWKALYRDYNGIAFADDVWQWVITDGNHTLRICGVPDVAKYEILIEKAKKVIVKNAIPPNRVEKVFQHLIKETDLTPVTVGLYK